jgi:outer membrane receptor for ferrienterochelin and colicin
MNDTIRFSRRHPLVRALAQAMALATGLGAATAALAQSTTGTLIGQVASGSGDTVLIQSANGLTREVPVDAKGRYVASQLPLGSYTVSLQQGGKTVDSHANVTLRVGAATNVSFNAAISVTASQSATNLDAVNVTGAALPAIDVTSVDSRTVVTAEQLARLPLGRSAEAIALLAPGVSRNTANFTSATGQALVSFGGSAASENAYYINGFNTTDPLNAAGGLTLPYGAIDQQEVYTGGYSAQYGRSDGGVINQVGKRGSNQWHFGAQMLWEPSFARSDYTDIYYANGLPKVPVAGGLYDPNSANSRSSTTVSAYAGGPLIEDKLFFFVAGEFQREESKSVNSVTSSSTPYQQNRYDDPRWYAKLDWNINDSNILELTGASDKREGSGSVYRYDYVNRTRGDYTRPYDRTKKGGDLYLAKYTGYLTDNLTVSAMYGELTTNDYDAPGDYNPNLTYVSGITEQNPALNGGVPRGNSQIGSLADPGRGNKTTNTRLDISYRLGDHTLSVGIDNQKAQAIDQGTRDSGPGYRWGYGHTDHPELPIIDGLGVPAPINFPNGASGYYVQKNIDSSLVTVRSEQRAQYIEDKWQLNDRWLLSLGLRNDQFTDYNPVGQAFITQTRPQWAPRLGFSWDVNGDSSFKVFGNAGRYYLGLPLNPATGAASGYTSTQQYYTYSGIAPDGTPTGLTQISNPVSANNSFGIPPDPNTVTARGIKAEYQDEFIVGFTKTAGAHWLYGAKLTQRILRTAIDDFCDVSLVTDKAAALGHAVGSSNSCYLINPGKANTFNLTDTAGNPFSVTLSNAELGFPQLKRRYYALDTFLEHPFDGHWYGRVDYTFSRSYGNTEGQLRSDLLQGGASASEDWDNAAIMVNTNGPQNNDHTHQLKLYGYYQFTPEWLVSANLRIQSGNPKICLGYFGPDHTDPVGYGNAYHWCDGQPSPPGSQGRLPWTHPLDLGVTYHPAFAGHKLGFSANVFNVFNEQRPTFLQPNSEQKAFTPNPLFGTALYREDPRYVRLSVNYDY